jgi:hypothetical protein
MIGNTDDEIHVNHRDGRTHERRVTEDPSRDSPTVGKENYMWIFHFSGHRDGADSSSMHRRTVKLSK